MRKLIGHASILKELVEFHSKKILPNKILLSGNKGIGKSLLVNHLLKSIYAKDNKMNIENLIDQNTHPNIFKIYKKDDKKTIEISQIRDMINFQNHSSFNNMHKTIVIDDIEFLNLSSTNALLKTLEEPNSQDIFILIYNSNFKISDTLKSRCIEFKLNLKQREIIDIINEYFNDQVYEKISNDFKNLYTSPSFIISFVSFLNENKIAYNELSIEKFLILISKIQKIILLKIIIMYLLNYFFSKI